MRQVPEQYLRKTLLDLHSRLDQKGIKLVLGGGFGLFLKQLDLSTKETQTLLPVVAWPKPRTTNDLDLFVPLELLVTLADMQEIRAILDELNFEAIQGSQFWQFVLPATEVKIDILTGPVTEEAKPQLKMDDNRRVRPKGDLKLHARHTPEALGLHENQEKILVPGQLSDGKEYQGMIHIPSPFSYLMMKITAFGDQVDNEKKDFGRHHALDIYRIVAMLDEEQYAQTKLQFAEHASDPSAQRVVSLVKELFGSTESPGIIRIKEHAFYDNNLDIDAFISALQDLIA